MFTALRSLGFRATRRTALVGLALAATIVSGCSTDSTVGPDVNASQASPAQPTNSLLASFGLIPSQALLRNTPLKKAITRSIKITSDGGTLSIPELGVTLTVPQDAIDTKTLTIKITALAGNAVAYSFEPHGVQFRRPLTLTQDLATTTWSSNKSWMLLTGGYFKDDAQLNTLTGQAQLDERLPLLVIGSRSYMSLWHFSGYMISMD